MAEHLDLAEICQRDVDTVKHEWESKVVLAGGLPMPVYCASLALFKICHKIIRESSLSQYLAGLFTSRLSQKS